MRLCSPILQMQLIVSYFILCLLSLIKNGVLLSLLINSSIDYNMLTTVAHAVAYTLQ